MSMDFDSEENNQILTLLNLSNEHMLGIMQTSLVIQWFIFAFYVCMFILCMVWRNVCHWTGAYKKTNLMESVFLSHTMWVPV